MPVVPAVDGKRWMSEDNFAYFWSKLKSRLSTANTTAYWNAHPGYQPAAGEIVIYIDRKVEQGVTYAGIKIGDGNAFVADLPFVGDVDMADINAHMANTTIHVSQSDRDRWDDKLNCDINGETLIFNRD